MVSVAALPAQPTPLIGREGAVEEICGRLRDPDVRLVTLTGVGGIGKTRLALAVAERVADAFPDGVLFVDLQPVSDPTHVCGAIARRLGVIETSDTPLLESIARYLGERSILLLLDNFEQVLPAAADVAVLLAVCPRLAILVTSRAPLRLRWEHEITVPPLAYPPAHGGAAPADLLGFAAAALFVGRARAVRPDFVVTEANAPFVAQVCARLEGLPLAIELAAARSKVLPPDTLLARLERPLAVLTGGARDTPARQQTLRDAIAWSYNLLPPERQRLFRRLGVFAGGCTLDAAEEICAEPIPLPSLPSQGRAGGAGLDLLDGLSALVDNSLLVAAAAPSTPIGSDPEPRFRMLETVREFALERITAAGEAMELRGRHVRFYLDVAERAEPALRGPEQMAWLRRLEAETDNLRAALAWCLTADGDLETGVRLAVALEWFWQLRSAYTEGRRWLDALLARAEAVPPSLRAAALYAAGSLARFQGDYAAARPLLEESVALLQELGDRRALAYALHWLGRTLWDSGERAPVLGLYDESIALFQQTGDRWGYALARDSRTSLGGHVPGVEPGQMAVVEENLATFRQLGDAWGIARSLTYAGTVTYEAGDQDRAAAIFEEFLAVSRELGNTRFVAHAQQNLGMVMLEQGNLDRAHSLLTETIPLRLALGDMDGLGGILAGLARVAAARQQWLQAARLFGAGAALRRSMGSAIPPEDRPGYQRALTATRAALDATRFAALWEEGSAMTPEQAVASALATQPPAGVPRAPGGGHAPAYPAGLTEREVEVLRRLAAGQSNREIADALVISVRTAERHIANIYEKIGAHDKTARATATAYAFRHGLA